MRDLLATGALVALSLALLATAVFGLGDGRTFVSPPGAVAESFVRALQCRRFPQAHRYLSAETRSRVTVETLAEATERLEARRGRIEDVKGEDAWLAGDAAEGAAMVKTRAGETRLALPMRRESGEWRVTGIDGLTPEG